MAQVIYLEEEEGEEEGEEEEQEVEEEEEQEEEVIHLAALLEVVEENPAVEALHLPRFLLPQENMLESAGAKDPAPAAV